MCHTEHEVQTVRLTESEEFKQVMVEFEATYEYCSLADEYQESEELNRQNSLAMKDAYREKVGLLASRDIRQIREKYNLSQKHLADILDWGNATITRYENHQVQDRVHDDVLRKIDSDTGWYIQLLDRSRAILPTNYYKKYRQIAQVEFRKNQNKYLRDSIQARHATSDKTINGGVELNLDKVIDMTNYFANKINDLYKVKLMKLLWYSDALSYQRRQQAISGLTYVALPMGAVPDGYDLIINLDGIKYEVTQLDNECIGYRFIPPHNFQSTSLSPEELDILNEVSNKLGHLSAKKISDKMHEERFFQANSQNSIISFELPHELFIK